MTAQLLALLEVVSAHDLCGQFFWKLCADNKSVFRSQSEVFAKCLGSRLSATMMTLGLDIEAFVLHGIRARVQKMRTANVEKQSQANNFLPRILLSFSILNCLHNTPEETNYQISSYTKSNTWLQLEWAAVDKNNLSCIFSMYHMSMDSIF